MKQLYFTVLLLLLTVVGLRAQVTTSTMTGLIKDAAGEASIGATVQATHLPSGTNYGTATNSEGRFTIQNMRIGGPYRVVISYIGSKTQTQDNVSLELGQPYVLNATLTAENTELAGVTVTGTDPRSTLNSDRTGSVTNISRTELQRLPSINRNLNDFTRLTPQANGTSIGGGSNRSNYFSVDGSDFNNNFGIGGNLPAGGAPISLDAIEAISVNVTPYDVRQSGFVGAAINAVTRAGTNDFSGSAYGYYNNQNYRGDKVGDERVVLQDQRFYQYGFRLGGPILKDKLFFFANFEDEEDRTPGQQRVAATPEAPFGSGTNISRPTAAELDQISSYLRDTYGYETGPYQGYSFTAPRTKILGRLDWNINAKHRFNVRYSQVEGKSPAFPSTSRSPFGGYTNGSGNRQQNTALFFRNAGYFSESNFYSLAAELNSSFGNNMANTLRATYTRQNDPRSSTSSLFPFVDILKDGTPFTSFGYEPFTYGNLRDVKIYSFKDDFTWTLGRHNLTLGAQVDLSETKNGFQRFGTGYYTFNSWEDFVNGRLPQDYGITYSLAPGFAQAFPSFEYGQYSVYAQDEIALTDRLRITPGLRVDLTSYPNKLQEHPLISPLTFANDEKINVANLPKSQVLWSPRVGFNYDVLGDRSLQLRGGTGIFTGRVPYVWIVSQAGDAGLLQVTQLYSGSQVPGPFNPDPAYYRPDTPPTPGTIIPSTTTSLARDFRFPQTWKSSLAVDAKLPLGIVGTLEGIVNRDLNAAVFRNANLINPVNAALNSTGSYPDHRVMYPAANTNKFVNPITTAGLPVANGTMGSNIGPYNAIVLDNASKGYYFSLTGKLDKKFSDNLFGSVAYTYTDAKNLYDGGGDQPLSAWQGTATINGANNLSLDYNGNTLPHRVVASLSYRREYLGHLGTTVSLFYEGASQGRYSYLYSSDFNRDGANADLIYIPRDASEIDFVPVTVGSGATAVTYSGQQQSDAFFAFIEQDDYLRKHKGEYARRNGATFPWRNQFDVKILQDVFTNIGDKRNTLQLSLDIFNVGNLLNNEWGRQQQRTVNNSAILEPVNTASLNPTLAPNGVRPTFRLVRDNITSQLVSSTYRDAVSLSSTYYMQIGLRYIFN
ncbi:carboxypeptidase regulatory-like domain-containing protein [Hymenobacter sp. YC55]|uniref:TonB-dependent receptor n=1 Tax=Hymenobacter sp. YC55 TaxID=3034019 RepID=UPI0023F693D9|nr:carboxypeptidase regulatory-like domain-containing protein [Hymenobacter sp. YC55]MDF7813986.1 carboxypeptidase regulatory-like domain-containing protein [Hymenobacter sp. YC55]